MATNNTHSATVPAQKLPMREKGKEWRENNVDAYVARYDFGYTNGSSRKEKMRVSYNLYNSVFDEGDFKHITDPYKVEDGFPATVQNFNIIKTKIDLLLGEETKRPFSFRVAQTNEEATSKLQEKYKEVLSKAIIETAIEGDPNAPVSDEEVNKLSQLANYMDKDYSDIAEQTAYHTLNYLMEKENIKDKFVEGFKDLLCSSKEVFYVGARNGDPVFERVNPIYFSHDYSPEVQFIEDGDWAVRRMRMTPSAIYDRFYDIMEEKDLNELIKMFEFNSSNTKASEVSDRYITWRNVPTKDYSNGEGTFDTGTIDVYHVTWKSLKKVGFVTYFDEEGEEQQVVVEEGYKVAPNEEISWDWVTEVWEGYRVGNDLYIGIQPIPNQSISLDNPNGNKLPYVGGVYNDTNTYPKSLVEIMKPLQYMYIVIWYRLELALSRDKGKVINMDVTQIPKSMGVDVNKWLHYLSSLGVNLFNPYEDGWDIPGREGGKPAGFNQFSSQDLTMSNVIAGYIEMMNKIEEMAGELSGVTRQRQGAISTNELVGNVERSVIQSSHITEMLFWKHNQVKKKALNSLLDTAKNVWGSSGKTKLHYITDDVTRVFMEITDDFKYSDFDIFVTDSTKENQNIESLRSLYQPAMQNGASLLDIAEIMTSNNLSDIKTKLKRIEQERQQKETQMQQVQQEAMLQAEQIKSQTEQAKMDLELAKIEQDERDSIRKSETAVEVAMIGAESKDATDRMNNTNKRIDAEVKEKELQESKRSNMAKENIDRMQKSTTNNN
jgi:hypothetical protein